mgnify:CR=1 FL=1
MRYMLMIYEDESVYGPTRSGPLLETMIARHMAFVAELGAARIAGAGLAEAAAATTVRVSGDERSLHDGPFAEAREQVGGFYIIDAPDLDAALAIARRVPVAGNGAVEVRPLLGGE